MTANLSGEKEERSSRTEPWDASIFGGQEDEKEPANDTEKEHPVQWEENQERVEARKPGGESSSRNEWSAGSESPKGPSDMGAEKHLFGK